jgi:hypothetical protein
VSGKQKKEKGELWSLFISIRGVFLASLTAVLVHPDPFGQQT